MHLTKHTDFAQRTLLYLAARGDEVVTIDAVAESFRINRHHLARWCSTWSRWVMSKRDVVRVAGWCWPRSRSSSASLAWCAISNRTSTCSNVSRHRPAPCPVTHACALKGVLGKARKAFFEVLMDYSRADVLGKPEALLKALGR